MRVLLITDWNRGRGGAEAYAGWLRAGLREAGDEVRLLTSSAGSAGDGTADYVAYGTEVKAAQTFLQLVNPFAVRAVRKAVQEFQPDVAWVNMFAHHLSPAIFNALGDVPIVLSVTDYKCVCPIGSKLQSNGTICDVPQGWVCHEAGCVNLAHWIRDRPRYALMRSAVSRAARVIACSKHVQRELELGGIASEVMYLPVPPPSAGYVQKRFAEPQIFFAGRLDREKGVKQLLLAFAQVASSNPLVKLRIAGRGPEREPLENLSRDLGLLSRAKFLGWLEPEEIERELSMAWALVAPSLWAEPQGLVALEAIVRQVPVVASGVGGFAEIVEDGVTGTLFRRGDIVALAAALLSIVQRRSFASGVPVDVAKRVSDTYSIASHVDQLRAMFSNITAASRGTFRSTGTHV